MATFGTLPFEEQLAHIEVVAGMVDPSALLREAGALPDAEPFARLLDALAERGRLEPALEDELAPILARMPDAGLLHVLTRSSPPEVSRVLERLAEDALERWPLERLGALAFAARWLRRRSPEAFARIEQLAARALERSPEPDAARWLLFASGSRLDSLARDPRWAELVRTTAHAALDVLARAPKSISQANAERLLAQRVYADPGHFFFELLQNADDAGARRWSVTVGSDRVIVRHDGTPFSFLDLIGVLSIGQTTKRADQIGFFGVGFKSVYEVCERPRVRSGAFAFEIAHVSIPRALAPSEDEAPAPGETVLVLPYARELDTRALHARALAVPPETLMTLPHLVELAVRGPRDGDEQRVREERDDAPGGALVRLVHDDGRQARAYRSTERTLRFEGAREEGRSRESAVIVAVALDAAGTPRAIEGPTIYSHLPTAERSGLRVLVHARFDVTLDRERLELGSAWNAALLGTAGEALAELVACLAREGAPVLAVLAAERELAPAVLPLASALRAGLSDVPCLLSASGDRIAPSRARIAPAPLAHALAGLDLGDATFALAPLAARELSVAADLGARSFDGADLAAFLARELAPGGPPPPWLTEAVLDALGDAPVGDEALRALPLLSDGAHRLVRAQDALVAPSRWAELYAGERALVSSEGVMALPAALRARLALMPFDLEELAIDLADPARREALTRRESLLFLALDELSDATLRSIDHVPIFPVLGTEERAGAGSVASLDPSLAPLAGALAHSTLLLPAAFVEEHHALVARWVRRFDLAALAEHLEAGLALDDVFGSRGGPREASLDVLTAILDALAPSLPRALLERFGALPLVRDRHGARRPLLGPARALRAESGLEPPLPEWPWLAEPAGAFAAAVDAPRVHARSIAGALIGDSELPRIPAARLEALQAWLAPRAGELSGALVERLASAPVFLDATRTPRPLSALRRGTSSAALDALYEALGLRFVASPGALSFARALGLDARLPPRDHALLVADLIELGGVPDDARAALAPALEEAARLLRPDELAPLLSVPLFADAAGVLRPLASWRAPDARACHRAGSFRAVLASGPWPLLASNDEARFATFLSLAGPAPADVSDVVEHAAALLADPAELLAFLDAHASALDDHARAAIAELPIFASGTGERAPAGALASRAPLLETLGAERLATLAIEDALLSPDAEAMVARLGIAARSTASLIEDRLRPMLREGAPLEAQPAPFDDHAGLVELTRLFSREAPATGLFPLALDAERRLVRGPCFTASEAVRALVVALPLASRLADARWALAVTAALDDVSALLAPLPARRVADALREACPDEAPREAHPTVRELDALYAWLSEIAGELASDEALRGALAGAAVIPSQRGTLRAPRDLVLDPDLPDLGLGWGLAPDVPSHVARSLRSAFEIDRRTRRALVTHVLDGLDEAAQADDAARAADLAGFLARALGARDVSAEVLEERVRRLDVRARLKVPVEHSDGRSWDKPRFAWAPSDAVAAHADRFARDLPPRIALASTDAPTQRLLAACGAKADLDEAAIERCLDGAIRPGSERALARYVAVRAIEVPARIDRWKLRTRAWVPAGSGALHRPHELLVPDRLARALFGERAPRFPDAEVIFDLEPDALLKLGFLRAETLGIAELARHLELREATPALLDWLEESLREGRFSREETRELLRPRLMLSDDEGTLRPVPALARSGARALFGPRRGDWSDASEVPLLARALGVPPRPDASMILAFLVEIGERVHELAPSERDGLAHALPACLAELSEKPARLPRGAAIAALRGGHVVLTRADDPSLRLLEPAALADALDAPVLDALLEPLPSDRSEALTALLLAAGVPDLFTAFEPRRLVPGPRREDRDEEAEALRASLAPVLPEIGRRARVHDSLAVRGVLALGASGYRGAPSSELVVPADAFVEGETLVLTPQALEEPARIAPALARDPARRAALAAWLREGRPEVPPPRAKKIDAPSADAPREGFFARVRRLFVEEPPPTPAREGGSVAPSRGPDEGFFRPLAELAAQLDRTEGWMNARREAPTFGFAFTPARLDPPWLYAPKLVAVRFDRRAQRWQPAPLRRPEARGDAGTLLFRGQLPAGEAVVPVPLYARVVDVRLDRAEASITESASGASVLRLDAASDVRIRMVLARPPSLESARPAREAAALESFVPDAELPGEVHDVLASLDEDEPAIARALALRDFVRERYRYDPSYLEDPALGRWLARVTRGRANAHVAALHAAADANHLGAGVCYELNALACELLRRAGIPCALATGWVLDGGQLSEADHLFALALFEDAQGAPIWVPIDASSTREGRPLRVPRRPPGRFRAPRDANVRPPEAPRWERLRVGREGRGERPAKKRAPPRAELRKVLHHLEKLAAQPLDAEERAELERALTDARAAAALLERLRDG